jgi:hypothetical protein
MAEIRRLNGLLASVTAENQARAEQYEADVKSLREEVAQSRRDFVRVADALGLVGFDGSGRVGAIASVEDIVEHARQAAWSLAREQPKPEGHEG